MVQIVATLFFIFAAALGLGVIRAMLGANRDAILSALIGDGAFPARVAPDRGPGPRVVPIRRAAPRNAASGTLPQFSRAA